MSDTTPNQGRHEAPEVTERDILAWADGQVASGSDLDHRVRAYVDARPELKSRIKAWEAQKEAIRSHYAPVFAESVPPHLQPSTLRARRRGHWQRRMQVSMAAGVAGVAVVVAVVGMRGETSVDPLQSFAQEVAQLGGSAPAGQSAERLGSAELSSADMLPDFGLAGFRPLERRNIAANDLSLTEVRYESKGGESLRLFMAREPIAPADEIHELQIDPRDPAATIVYWRQDGWMYALAGEAAATKHLRELAVATLRGDRRQRQFAANPAEGDDDSSMASVDAAEVPAETHGEESSRQPSDPEAAPAELGNPRHQPEGSGVSKPVMHQFEDVSF